MALRTRQLPDRWQLIMAIPTTSLGLEDPGPGRRLGLNIGVVRSIAPTLFASWRYWGRPFDPEHSLGWAEWH